MPTDGGSRARLPSDPTNSAVQRPHRAIVLAVLHDAFVCGDDLVPTTAFVIDDSCWLHDGDRAQGKMVHGTRQMPMVIVAVNRRQQIHQDV